MGGAAASRIARLIGYDGGMAADVFVHDIYFAINYWFLGAVALVTIAAVTYWWRSKRRH
jgi:membrane protein DedA with SNARE-associated domain